MLQRMSLKFSRNVCAGFLPRTFEKNNAIYSASSFAIKTMSSEKEGESSLRSTFDKQRKLEAKKIFSIYAHGKKIDLAGFKCILRTLGKTEDDPQVKALLEDFKDGINFETFVSHCDEIARDINQSIDEVRNVFNVFDRDGNGMISPVELTSILNTCGSPMSLQEASDLIRAVDTDRNGEICFDEFCNLLNDGLIGWRFRTGYRVVFLLGGPGSGKGTLYKQISERLNSAHVSTGDLLRQEVEKKTELGVHVAEVMASGNLVNPVIIMKLLRDTLVQYPGKYVFVDGFPRSVQNTLDFYAICGVPECAIWLDTTDETLTSRLMNRGLSSGRADDNLETIKKRLKTYHDAVDPLQAHFNSVNLPLYKLDASQSIDVLTEKFFQIPLFKAQENKI